MDADDGISGKLRGGTRMARLLAPLFHRIIDRIDQGLDAGELEGWLPDGTVRLLGGRAPGPKVIVKLKSWMALVRLIRSGSAGWYLAWEKGEWSSPDPVPLFDLFMRNRQGLGGTARARGISRLVKRIGHALRRNDRKGARRNIEFHYDLGNDFYSEWLDQTMSYSSALFDDPTSENESLEAAQTRKIHALLDRLILKPDDRLIEIGCGWGGLAEVAARDYGADVTGITLSTEQKRFAETRVMTAGLAPKVHFELVDYRDAKGQYDALASVEMVEAVGREYWEAYLRALHGLLKPGGRAAIQYISIADDVFENYAESMDFIQAYVFPGGMLISERRFKALVEKAGFLWQDRRAFGLHYAETLRRWRVNFDAAASLGRLPAQFDRRFINFWRYYLMYCEGGFRGGGIDVAQVTLIKA